MSDTTITSVPESAGTAETTAADQTSAPGNAAPETNGSEGGESQGSAEGGQSEAGQGRRRWNLQDEVKELRAQRRELRERLSSFDDVRNELSQLREQLNRQNQPNTAKTPANFWQDPEGALDSKLEEKLSRLRDEITGTFQTSREQEYQQQALRQEQASAVEFIRSQKNYSAEDDEDLIEIIEGIPNRQHLSPQWVAEYAWMKLQQKHGIGDRGLAKRQAAGIQGQPPGAGFGRKNWSKAEFDAALDMIEKAPHDPKHSELIKELEAAHKEGRVR